MNNRTNPLALYSFLLYIPLLAACQSYSSEQANKVIPPTNIYLNSAFKSDNYIHIEIEEEIFQIDDAMRSMVKQKLTHDLTARQKALTLLEHLFTKENVALKYVGSANLTAREAYHSQIANCMSLTIMAYALAKEAGMNIYFQDVAVPEYWTRNGQYSLLTGHVNLLVKENTAVNKQLVWGAKNTQIDFDPFISKKKFPAKIIDKNRLLAMFYSNKGVDALVDNNFPVAYQYFKKATLVDSHLASAWGNLGILYKLAGHYELAEQTYRYSINLKGNNLTTLGNLALLLRSQGRNDEASLIELNIHKRRIRNPYYHALLGNEALFSHNYEDALKHYKKAISLDDEQHEFYFALAKIYFHQNEVNLAQRALRKAIVFTNAKDRQRQYIAKLNFLRYQ